MCKYISLIQESVQTKSGFKVKTEYCNNLKSAVIVSLLPLLDLALDLLIASHDLRARGARVRVRDVRWMRDSGSRCGCRRLSVGQVNTVLPQLTLWTARKKLKK